MSYVFNLHGKGADGLDWFDSDKYTEQQVEQIRDPEAGTGSFLPTAIPSPFARFDLVKTAFATLSRTPELKSHQNNNISIGSREDEKLVSDALDLLEMLFNHSNFADTLKLVAWDPKVQIPEMLNSNETGHNRVADAMNLFLRQDSDAYNFGKVQRLYLFVYKFQVIGCTSPLTLAAATGNSLEGLELRLSADYKLLDTEYDPLYSRDAEFQLYLYRLAESFPDFSKAMPGLYAYLEKNKSILKTKQPRLYQAIMQIKKEDYPASYSAISIGQSGNPVEVLGTQIFCQKPDDLHKAIRESELLIRCSSGAVLHDNMPLVLQNDLTKPFRYIKKDWERNMPVPYADHRELDKRTLPGQNITYPYLTVSDFLEPVLVRLVYPIDKKRFFDGNLKVESGNNNTGYLLPIRKQFFDYFTVSDLLTRVHADNKPWLEIRQIASENVVVELRIPVAKPGEYITFSRRYSPAPAYEAPQYDEQANKGVIIEHQCGISLFPFFRCNDPDVPPLYRVQLIDRDINGLYRDQTPVLNFLEKGKKTTVARATQRANKTQNKQYGSVYYSLDTNFDAIAVETQYARGLIIPRWPGIQLGDQRVSFAVDFGTSNSHIEYAASDTVPPQELSFSEAEEEQLVASLFDPDEKKTSRDFGGSGAYMIRDAIEKEFLPWEIGPGHTFRFPQRTVLTSTKGLHVTDDMLSLSDFNIGFTYEKYVTGAQTDVHTNLKWKSQEMSGKTRIRLFFEQLMLMMRLKAMLKGAKPGLVRIAWSYPFSMEKGRVNELKNMIAGEYKKVFNPSYEAESDQADKPSLSGLPESLGPYYFYRYTNRLHGSVAGRPALSIDIGGGTTDVILFAGDTARMGSSFRFAVNAVFGGLMNDARATDNGILQKYLPLFEKRLNDYGHSELLRVCNELKASHSAADMASFLFSLENSSSIKDTRPFNFNSMLVHDDDLRIGFIFFYCALLYHIAQMFRAYYEERNESPVIPGNILFSGNGSRMLQVISTDTESLSNLASLIFSHVLGIKTSDRARVSLEKNFPKASTSKGGIYYLRLGKQEIDFKAIGKVFHPAESPEGKITFDKVDAGFFKRYNESVREFADFFSGLNRSISFTKELNVSSEAWALFQRKLYNELETAEDVFTDYRRMDGIPEDSTDPLVETLFFYPVIRTINARWPDLANINPIKF